jgi:hypothetical protein
MKENGKSNEKLSIFTLLYWKYIIHFILLNWKYVHNVFTILLPQPHGACTVLTLVWEEFLSVALWKPLSRRSKRWPSLTFWYTSVIKSEAAYVIRRLTSRCLEHKQPSRVGGSPLCDVVSSFLCHTHTDGKDKLLEWPDRSCLLLYVSARIH